MFLFEKKNVTEGCCAHKLNGTDWFSGTGFKHGSHVNQIFALMQLLFLTFKRAWIGFIIRISRLMYFWTKKKDEDISPLRNILLNI